MEKFIHAIAKVMIEDINLKNSIRKSIFSLVKQNKERIFFLDIEFAFRLL